MEKHVLDSSRALNPSGSDPSSIKSDNVLNVDNEIIKNTTKARRWCFTWNNYTKENVEYLKNIPANKCDFIIFGFEIAPDTGTPHLQGYVEFSTPIALTTVKSRLDPLCKQKSKVWVKSAYKDRDANINYASKTASKDPAAAAIYGSEVLEISHKIRSQGSRSDWHEMHDFIKDKPDFSEFAEKYPEEAIKYHAGIDRLIRAEKERIMKIEFEQSFDDCKLRDWQSDLVNQVTKFNADDRKVIWIYEKTGNIGKTWMSRYLVAKHKAIRFENASSKDIAFAYNGEPIVIFDYSRTTEERINYQVIESLKNGMIFSAKYNSCSKYFNSPHVICFANWPPKTSSMSMDRWIIKCMDKHVLDSVRAQDPSGSEMSPIKSDYVLNVDESEKDFFLPQFATNSATEHKREHVDIIDGIQGYLQSRNIDPTDLGEIAEYSDGFLELSPSELVVINELSTESDNILSEDDDIFEMIRNI